MIHKLYSDLPTFKNLEFHAGLNLLISDRQAGATEKQTRNRAGKSSFVELVHFLLGGNCSADSLCRRGPLIDSEFGLVLDVANCRIDVSRRGNDPAKVTIVGDTAHWPIPPTLNREHSLQLSNENWKRNLGQLWFGLQPTRVKFTPSFRSLFSYFARNQNAGGLVEFKSQSKEQAAWDQQVALSFLLGLDWTIASEFEQLRNQEKSLKSLKAAASDGALSELVGSVAQLRTQLALQERQLLELRRQLADYRVHDHYHEIEQQASRVNQEILELVNANALDHQSLEQLNATVLDEKPPTLRDLQKVYGEVGIALPQAVLQRYDEVSRFHESVVRNRKAYLEQQILRLRKQIQDRNSKKEKLDKTRSELLHILQSYGALDHFSQLQGQLGRQEAALERLRQRYQAAEMLESTRAHITAERAHLRERLRLDQSEQQQTLNEAIVAFEEISSQLYEVAGSLVVGVADAGATFAVEIQGKSSKGIQNMQIFCFDLMMMRLCSQRGIGPGFLIHDSHLFDGVDTRQVASGLRIGREMAERFGFQYIVTLNSDTLPESLERQIIDDCVLPIRLTDAQEDGGLFGIRF